MWCSFCQTEFDSNDLDHWYVWNHKWACKFRRQAASRRHYTQNTSSENERSKARYIRHREDELVKMRLWYRSHREVRKQSMAEWRKANRLYLLQYYKNKRATDPQFKIACNLRTRLWSALKYGSRAGSAVRDCGCPMADLIVHLESQWTSGMSWDNYGQRPGCWNIDHILPLSKFDLTDPQQVKIACHYSNLRPMWAEDNYSKSDL